MTMLRFITAAAAIGGLAAPVAAQYPYPQQPYPQTYPGYPQQGYGYGYGQPGYGGQGAIGQIIDQLLGNRYNVNDRRAVSQCAAAAVAQAQAQYRGRGYNQGYPGYNPGYPGYSGQGFAAPAMRVTAITDVQRRSSGLRVSGLIDTAYRGNPYGTYGNQGYAGAGDLAFRCNVDYRGYVTNVRINRNNNYRRY